MPERKPDDPNPRPPLPRWPPLDLSSQQGTPFPDLDLWHGFTPSPGLVLLAAIACDYIEQVPRHERPLKPLERLPDGTLMLAELGAAIGMVGTQPKNEPAIFLSPSEADAARARSNMRQFGRQIKDWTGCLYRSTTALGELIHDEVLASLAPHLPDARPPQWAIGNVARIFDSRSAMAVVLNDRSDPRGPSQLGSIARVRIGPQNQPVYALWGFPSTYFASHSVAEYAGHLFPHYPGGIQGMWQFACEFACSTAAKAPPHDADNMIEGFSAMLLCFARGWALCQGMPLAQIVRYSVVLAGRIRRGLRYAARFHEDWPNHPPAVSMELDEAAEVLAQIERTSHRTGRALRFDSRAVAHMKKALDAVDRSSRSDNVATRFIAEAMLRGFNPTPAQEAPLQSADFERLTSLTQPHQRDTVKQDLLTLLTHGELAQNPDSWLDAARRLVEWAKRFQTAAPSDGAPDDDTQDAAP